MPRALIAALACLSLLAGCVTERVTRSGRESVRSTPPPQQQQPGTSPQNSANAPAAPSGPIAAPADNQTRSGRVLLAVRPFGFIDYDGVILPVISPDGAMVAVSSGHPPEWPAILAAPDAAVPRDNTIAVYELSQAGLRRVQIAQPLNGLLLGRAASKDGFLVEGLQPDGGRWIGLADWRSGAIRWLVQGPEVASHAIFLRTGELIYSRRRQGEAMCELVVQRPDGSTRTLADPGRSLLMPLASPDQKTVAVFSVGPDRMEIVAVAGIDGPGQPLRVATRLPLAGFGSPIHAFQAAAPVEATPAELGQTPDPLAQRLASAVAFGNPRTGRICLYETALSAESVLPEGVMAATSVAMNAGTGALATGKSSLDLIGVRLGNSGGLEVAGAMTGLSGPYVARGTLQSDRFVLFGPAGATDAGRLQVVGLQLLAAPAEPNVAPRQ